MKIATIKYNSQPTASIVTNFGYLPLPLINQKFHKDWPIDLLSILTNECLEDIKQWFNQNQIGSSTDICKLCIPKEKVIFAPLYLHPRKIWGIGLNYQEHAKDLSEKAPTSEPASFMKPDTTIIGHKDTIKLPFFQD